MTANTDRGGYVDTNLSADLAAAALDLARKFHDGATLWVISPQWEPHAHHVAVRPHVLEDGQILLRLELEELVVPGRLELDVAPGRYVIVVLLIGKK